MKMSWKAARQEQLSLYSPAKINLFFRVLTKREDGFHEIASCYQAISLADHLEVSLSQEDYLTTSHPSLAMDEHNLVCKALALFRKKTGLLQPFCLHLDKKIPLQAGLGGGSSNAATALWAFCRLCGLSLSSLELQEWGAELGSDVPFFFSQGTAYAEGRGEKITSLPSLPPKSFWIVKPPFGLSTPRVFGVCAPALLEKRDPKESLTILLKGGRGSYNDLEEAAFSLEPSLAELKKTLIAAGGQEVVLSGSGTAFFCTGSIRKEILPPELECFFVKSLQRQEEDWYELGPICYPGL